MGDREGTQGRGVWRIKGVEEEEEDERWGGACGELGRAWRYSVWCTVEPERLVISGKIQGANC